MPSEATKMAERAVERISLTRREAHNAGGHSGHIQPREYARARERVAENEAKGYRLDGMPQSSIYGVQPRDPEEQRKAWERAALMAAIADYKAEQKQPEAEQKPVEVEQNGNLMAALRQMQENQARLEALVAGLMAKKEEEHAAGSNAKADDPGKPESDAGKADDKTGADGVRPEAAGRDRERGNEDRGSAPEAVRGREPRGKAKLTTAQMYEIHERYKAGGVTLQELAQEYGMDKSSVGATVKKIDYGMPVRGYEEGYRRVKTVMFPALEDWRREQKMSIEEMARAAGMSAMTLRMVITGRGYATGAQEQGPRMSTIDKILKLTGMTYEEAFRRDDGNKDLQRR